MPISHRGDPDGDWGLLLRLPAIECAKWQSQTVACLAARWALASEFLLLKLLCGFCYAGSLEADTAPALRNGHDAPYFHVVGVGAATRHRLHPVVRLDHDRGWIVHGVDPAYDFRVLRTQCAA